MRLLFDQNISFRLVNRITDIFPETVQVRQLLRKNQYLIQEFLKDKKAGCLKLFGE